MVEERSVLRWTRKRRRRGVSQAWEQTGATGEHHHHHNQTSVPRRLSYVATAASAAATKRSTT
ncbi:hypothetical protein E2C01_090520 [Portunus trituberculatus]|uniref:Uncharacterized protein n=1 Tax=Portunus trituberculatus TaxID=210409 RepID=A0A5B7JL30_PORTR|nr:hypothetical protein [Portunus trituberculatus]